MECQRWPEKLLLWRRSGTHSVAMVTELMSLHCGTDSVASFCKESNIPDTNWLRYLFLIIFKQNLVECTRMTALKRKTISLHAVYLFMFQNGLDRKDAIFVIVPL